MDRARSQTDNLLNDLEKRVKAVYVTDPSLAKIRIKFKRYMNYVSEQTKDSYMAYQSAETQEEKIKAKTVYMDEVKKLTLENKTYKSIIKEFTQIMAVVNQNALDLVNSEVERVYIDNYNQVAVDCKKVGIKVNG